MKKWWPLDSIIDILNQLLILTSTKTSKDSYHVKTSSAWQNTVLSTVWEIRLIYKTFTFRLILLKWFCVDLKRIRPLPKNYTHRACWIKPSWSASWYLPSPDMVFPSYTDLLNISHLLTSAVPWRVSYIKWYPLASLVSVSRSCTTIE